MTPSLIRQNELALKEIYRPGTKRDSLSPELRSVYIRSSATMESYLERLATWTHWLKREGIVLDKLCRAHLHGHVWVQHGLVDAGRSLWTVQGAVSALRKLEHGIRFRWHRRVHLIVPEALDLGGRRRTLDSRRRRDGYDPDELRAIRAVIAAEYRPAIAAIEHLGLRRHELVAVRAQDVDLSTTVFTVKRADGRLELHPIPRSYVGRVMVRRGKGGKAREVPVPEEYVRTLLDLVLQAPEPHARLWPVRPKDLLRVVWDACKLTGIPPGGVHAIRKSWAEASIARLVALGHDVKNARQFASWWLGHNRLQVTRSYARW